MGWYEKTASVLGAPRKSKTSPFKSRALTLTTVPRSSTIINDLYLIFENSTAVRLGQLSRVGRLICEEFSFFVIWSIKLVLPGQTCLNGQYGLKLIALSFCL